MAIPILPLLLVAVGLTACAKIAATEPKDKQLYSLAGSEWGHQDNTEQFVQFRSGGEMSGHGGCNNFFGTYDLNGTELTIGPIASTKKVCRDSMVDERAFLNALQSARKIEATRTSLTLLSENGEPLLTLNRRDWD